MMERDSTENTQRLGSSSKGSRGKSAAKIRETNADNSPASKRRCVSTACIACRRRKSKCDGNLPSCASCSSVYHTTCVYDPTSDHRRKGVYKKDALRTKNSTLQTLIQALLNYDEEDAFELVRQIRSCDNLEDVAQSIISQAKGSLGDDVVPSENETSISADQFESELSGMMSELMLDGSRKLIGGTSNLIFLPPGSELYEFDPASNGRRLDRSHDHSVTRWTRVTDDEQLISHLMTMYFTWHYPFFTTLSKDLFYRDYTQGISSQYCSSLLINAMLALGCHFSSWKGSREDPTNPATAGDHFFREAKRLVLEDDEHANAKLCTVQALALMSVREAGCGREGKGWVYSGMSFRMAFDLGLNIDSTSLGTRNLSEEEVDARRITFWGCFLFDKCWSNYLGRQPQLLTSNVHAPKADILPNEEAELWSPYTDSGPTPEHTQPSRTRSVALQIATLCEISGDLLVFFYDPTPTEKPLSKRVELKKLGEIHTRLEAWKKGLPKELEPKEGQLPQVLVMHMFYHLLLIHLYRPFLKYTKSTSPLPQHVSPRKLCTQAASAISKMLRLYKRTYGFKQVVNIVVYIAHTACTIHLLNLPEKNAQQDIIHGLRSLDEMGESWLCARRTLRILDISANKWQVELPNEALTIFEKTHNKWGSWGSWGQPTSPSSSEEFLSTGAVQSLTAISSSFSSFGRPDAANQHGNDSKQNVANLSGPMGPQSCPRPSTHTSLAPVRAAHQSSSAPFKQTNTPLPEPTYLRPISNTFQPIHPVPITQHNIWYNLHQDQIRTPNTEQNNTRSATSAPPITGFDGPKNLVEESQDWWTQKPNPLSYQMESWEQGWNPGITSALRYESNDPGARQTSRGDDSSKSPQSLRFLDRVPPNMAESEQNSTITGYNNLVFPNNF